MVDSNLQIPINGTSRTLVSGVGEPKLDLSVWHRFFLYYAKQTGQIVVYPVRTSDTECVYWHFNVKDNEARIG